MKKKTIPFVILTLLHLILLGYTLFYKKKQNVWILLLSSISIAFVFEYFVLNVFKMYMYYPKVFKNKWQDSVFGGILSQAVFVPIKATFLASFQYGWRGRIIAGIAFSLVERLFIFLGVFKNITWRTTYTLTLIPMYFWIVQKWWNGLQRNVDGIKKGTLFFCYWTIYTNTYFILTTVFKKFLFQTGFVRNKYRDDYLTGPIYTFLLSMIGTISTLFMKGKWKILGVVIMHICDQAILKLGILRMKNWNVYAFLPLHLLMLLVGEHSQSMIQKISKKEFIK
ncbi:hypothetical protein ACOI1C_13520 [Bacillus sp. DJP31]|uniref:hypothetical protein n=1 Tax=Bacillus sp. DJP31 TaxID=3409789 RepID=UPI003BB4F741